MRTHELTAEVPFAERVEERVVGPCRVFVLKTPTPGIVSWRGSFAAHPDFAAGDELVQVLTVELLDKGTAHRDRFELAEVLENRGAHLSFSSNGRYVGFEGQALRDDLPAVLDVMAEQLRVPLFDADEFEKARAQVLAGLQRGLENTGSQASGALSRRIYGPAHPNYSAPTRHSIERLAAFTPEQVRAYHAAHFGSNDLLLVLVGDVEADAVETAVRAAFGDWGPHDAPPAFETAADPQPPGTTDVPIPDKMNVDVRLGHALPVRRDDDDYLPLFLATFLLGGNFSSRLMTTVRDEMGLTYGIRAGLSGLSTDYDGHLQISVTLSQENIERGTAATRAEVQRLVEEGTTDDELSDTKTTVQGSYLVGLATTQGLAATLHRNARRGFDVAYLDRYPHLVEAVTRDRLDAVVRQHLRPDALQCARAGMLPGADFGGLGAG